MTEDPWLTVVVPVHRVEDYLVRCLDSVLAEAGAGVEVVAVNDASPDGCGAILDGYASRDNRVRVVHLATNVGLGRARNTGLEHARGRYVWFVDSDDWVPPGAVPGVRERLAAKSPDVLVVGHVEVGADGQVRDEAWPPPAEVGEPTPLGQRPELLRLPLATSACTKIVRRELLSETGLRFPPGWYEDVAYAVPLLLAADRIDLLDRVCYCYRRRDGEAITKSLSSRHFDLFDQYDRMWARVPSHDPLRPELFRMMVSHLLVVAGNRDRLPRGRRREFFRQAAAAYRRWRPQSGYEIPGGAAGLKHRLVRGNVYPAYAALRLAWRATGRRQRPAFVPAQAVYEPDRQIGHKVK